MAPAAREEVHPDELAAIPLFAELTAGERALVAACARRDVVPAGLTVAVLGERGEHFYVIEEGQARVTEEYRRLGDLGPGDFFGEIALISSEWRTATVQAVTTMHLIRLSKATFGALLEAEPTLAERLAATARGRSERTDAAP